MHVLSINVGQPRSIKRKPGQESITGIYKTPAEGPVGITTEGLIGDHILNKKVHGGPDQAVYIYGQADYDFWKDELGEMITPGLFGENLTFSDLESAEFNIGDIFHIGDVVLQVTKPRSPCSTLAAKIGDPTFVRKFRQAGRPGLYCRVLQTGEITAGDTVTVEKYQGDTVSIPEMVENYNHPDKSEAGLRRFLAAPIAIRDREAFEAMLSKLNPE
jgi:MOSC domain-containing protein YiiM